MCLKFHKDQGQSQKMSEDTERQSLDRGLFCWFHEGSFERLFGWGVTCNPGRPDQIGWSRLDQPALNRYATLAAGSPTDASDLKYLGWLLRVRSKLKGSYQT
jgi:hypothetical protein